MKKYKKNFMKHHNLAPGEYFPCEYCKAPAVDIHHVKFKSQGGTDDVDNLIGLCRSCHIKHH